MTDNKVVDLRPMLASLASDQDPAEARGELFTSIQCPRCGTAWFIEGNQDGCETECIECSARLFVRVDD
jgi:hypothetical protein